MKAKIVQMVEGRMYATVVDVENLIPAMEVRNATVVGVKRSRSIKLRPELEGQPMFSSFLGPMYDVIDGEPAIRYEDQEVNNVFSH